MSTAKFIDQLEYPESDGQPMGETDTHRKWMIRIHDILNYRYRQERVYTASDLLVYYEPGQVTRFVVPDVFLVLDSDPGERRIFKIWEEERVPNVVIEVTSKSTSHQDLVAKPQIYERIGVQEYFLFDPTSEYLLPALRGFRLCDGILTEIEAERSVLTCETLNIDLSLIGGRLEMFDRDTGKKLLTEAEANLHDADEQRRNVEEQRRYADEQRAARLQAEERIRELEAELLRHRRGEG